MATVAASSPSQLSSVRVNVRLCGSIPREEMETLSLTKCAPHVLRTLNGLNTSSYLAGTNGSSDDCVSMVSSTLHTIGDNTNNMGSHLCSQLSKVQESESLPVSSTMPQRRITPSFEPPSWAVPASGEARLEPVCESVERQSPVDLTSKSVFRIGRSPQSDVQLLHATSSRRHALLFHHANGSCYVVDCGSAHGTYINGLRVDSAPRDGMVVPHKVRRGSMIRFGGPGAPVFMLKSFAFDLQEMKGYQVCGNPATSPSQPNFGAVVQHNTRLNALGKTAKDFVTMSISSKRSFDSIGSFDSVETCGKRPRCSSPLLFAEEPVRLVSPDSCQPNKRRRVSFSNDPPRIFYPALITPDLSSDETDYNDNDCDESI